MGLKEKIEQISDKPGVYLMKSASGLYIYIGKAKNLRKRVSSYFNKKHEDIKTNVLVNKIKDIETIITETEQEALLLESTLIKKHKPKYNIVLKDDKRYKILKLDLKEDYPYIQVVRKIENDKALYFGPYTSGGDLTRTIKIINKTFKLRKCRSKNFRSRTRPCLNYQIGTCLGPCCLKVDKKTYMEIVDEVKMFLKGKTYDLVKKIEIQMKEEALNQKFEEAATLRDKLFSLKKIVERQVTVSNDFKDKDVISGAFSLEKIVITVLSIRSGFLNKTQHFKFKQTISDKREVFRTFINQFYDKTKSIPNEILIPIKIDSAIIEGLLTETKGKKVKILCPTRGEKKLLIEMADNNAEKELKNLLEAEQQREGLLKRLSKKLGMDIIPNRIECFDNSNISGTNPVSAMVVFKNGKPDKSSYRKYIIKNVKEQDDYAYMKEVLTRRFRKKDNEYPDILMVDGGKGQLGIATTVLESLGIFGDFTVIGIAKKDVEKGEDLDKIILPGRSNPLNLSKDKDILMLLERIRDESHRFAITFHRKRRGKKAIVSELDSIEGVGLKRKKALIKYFGSISKIKKATVDEINAIPEMNLKISEKVFEKMNRGNSKN
ncbi:MAG: excinuclease ABC subunit UvrC [Desulfobacterales bacterium]|nr:excinuclease ABC subunit UvrC [Desulfobacterales bacterium]